MANTTAKQRELARLYESRCEWEMAAQCWQAALDLYPNVPGELAKRDRATIASRRDDCRRMS